MRESPRHHRCSAIGRPPVMHNDFVLAPPCLLCPLIRASNAFRARYVMPRAATGPPASPHDAGSCQLVEAETLIGHTDIALRSYLPMKQPTSCPSSWPNSQSSSMSLPLHVWQLVAAVEHRLRRYVSPHDQRKLTLGRRQPVGRALASAGAWCDRWSVSDPSAANLSSSASRLTVPMFVRPFGDSGSMK